VLRALRNPALALVVVAASFAFVQWWDFRLPSLGAKRYQAVFLTSGQIYFGHYFDRLGSYARVDDVFYVQSAPQNPANPDAPAQSKLIARGNEVHQPLPRILVAKDAILFVEDLKADSPVAQFMNQNAR